MSLWLSIVFAGIINYLTRLVSVLVINPKKLNSNTKKILEYVPSAVFPAIIFPAVFLDNNGGLTELNDPRIFGILIAFIIGCITRNITITIISGILVYWIIIFI